MKVIATEKGWYGNKIINEGEDFDYKGKKLPRWVKPLKGKENVDKELIQKLNDLKDIAKYYELKIKNEGELSVEEAVKAYEDAIEAAKIEKAKAEEESETDEAPVDGEQAEGVEDAQQDETAEQKGFTAEGDFVSNEAEQKTGLIGGIINQLFN